MEMDKYLLKCFALSTGVLSEKLWRAAYTLTDEEKEKFGKEYRCLTVARSKLF